MSQRHLDLVAFLDPCRGARNWLIALPDGTSESEAWRSAEPEWRSWLRNKIDGKSDPEVEAVLMAVPELVPTLRTPAFWRALRAGALDDTKTYRRALRVAHPADAWTVPIVLAVPIFPRPIPDGGSQ